MDLYFDPVVGTWHLAAGGAATATVGCVPWSAFGGPAPLSRFDNGGSSASVVNPAGTPGEVVVGDGGADCFISDVEGDIVASGNGVAIDDAGALTVTNAAGDGVYASETCFAGASAVPYTDFVVDARQGALSVPVMPDDQALRGLSQLAAFSGANSSVTLSGGRALGSLSLSTVRCFLFSTSQ